MLPKIILVPTDFSEASEVALDYAVELATRVDAKVHLFHAISLPGDVESSLVMTPAAGDELRAASQDAADKLVAARAMKASLAPPRIAIGDPRIEIEAEAKRIGAELIVMSTHGRRGIKRLLLGSVAEAIVRIAPCPVLLLRAIPS